MTRPDRKGGARCGTEIGEAEEKASDSGWTSVTPGQQGQGVPDVDAQPVVHFTLMVLRTRAAECELCLACYALIAGDRTELEDPLDGRPLLLILMVVTDESVRERERE